MTNVLLVITDDMDNELIRYMPYLSSLPEGNWIRFSNSYESTPLCGPCRANIYLGQRFTETGVDENSDALAAMNARLADAVWTRLQSDGYKTALIGKYINLYQFGSAAPSGLDKAFICDSEGADADGYINDWDFRDFSVSPAVNTTVTNSTDYKTDRLSAEAVEFIAAQAGVPWVCIVAYGAPHGPTVPAARHAASSITMADPLHAQRLITTSRPAWMPTSAASGGNFGDSRTQRLAAARCMLAVDEGLEDIVAQIDANNELDDTVIIFVNDNGSGWGRNGLQNSAAGIKRNPMRWCLDASLMIRYPGVESRIERRLVSTLDITATIYDIAGVDPPYTLPGRSLVPLIENTATEWRTSVHSAFVGLDETTMPDWWHVRSERWAYSELDENDDGTFEETTLFDLNADPYEESNIAGANGAVVTAMAALVAAYKADPTLFPTS